MLILFVCVGFNLFSTSVAAANFQSHASIFGTARQFILQRIHTVYKKRPDIKNGNLDSRLKLNQCSRPLVAYLPKGSRDLGRITVGVKCPAVKSWSLHVPMSVSIYKKVLIAAYSIPRGKVLLKEDFKLAKYDLARLPNGYIENLSQIQGMKLTRNLSIGVPLSPSMIKKPQIIKRGQRIFIIARSGKLEVRMSGKALAHGAVGDRIAVVNLSSKKKLEGVIMKDGTVNVEI